MLKNLLSVALVYPVNIDIIILTLQQPAKLCALDWSVVGQIAPVYSNQAKLASQVCG